MAVQAPYSEQSGRVSEPVSEPSCVGRGFTSEAADARPQQAMPGQLAEPNEAPPEAASQPAEAEGRLTGEVFYDASDGVQYSFYLKFKKL